MANIITGTVYVTKESCPKCIEGKSGCFLYNYYMLNNNDYVISDGCIGDAYAYSIYSKQSALKEGQFKKLIAQINNICNTCKKMYEQEK